jgi:hypothetical protein
MLVPRFHRNYWVGLNATEDAWPNYRWLDPYVPDPDSKRGFKNWGTVVNPDDGSFVQEPSDPGQLCGAASWPLQRGSPPSWGWTGADCSKEYVFVCRVQGECGPKWLLLCKGLCLIWLPGSMVPDCLMQLLCSCMDVA